MQLTTTEQVKTTSTLNHVIATHTMETGEWISAQYDASEYTEADAGAALLENLYDGSWNLLHSHEDDMITVREYEADYSYMGDE